jgi:hypothetical protein
MGLNTLMEGYQALMAHIYSPRHYYQRVKTLLSEFGVPQARTPMDLQRALAFFRSSLRLGILGKERFEYWRLLLWTLFRKPRQLPLAITLTIYGHHFRRICELYIL